MFDLSPVQQSLLDRTLLLLAWQLILASGSAYAFRRFFSLPFLLGSFAVSIVLILIIFLGFGKSDAFMPIFILTGLFGVAEGSTLGGFFLALAVKYELDEDQTRKAIGLTSLITLGLTALAAGIGLLTHYNLQGLNGWLVGIVLVVIAGSLLGASSYFGKFWHFLSGMGMVILFFIWAIVDFNRFIVTLEDDRWGHAAQIAMNIFLDIINILVHLAPYIFEAMKKK